MKDSSKFLHLTLIVVSGLLCLVTIFGCKSARSTTKTDSTIELTNDSTHTEVNASSSTTETSTESTKGSVIETVIVTIFDTSKSKDESTGQHPVKSKVEKRKETNTEGNRKTLKKENTDVDLTQDKGTESLKTSDKTEEEDINPVQPIKQTTHLVWALVALIVAIVGGIALLRLRGNSG